MALEIDELLEKERRVFVSSLKTINELFGGEPYASDTIFAVYALPGVGKTLLMLQEAAWFEAHGYNVLMIDTEGSLGSFARKWLPVLRERFKSVGGKKRGKIYATVKKSVESLAEFFGWKIEIAMKGSKMELVFKDKIKEKDVEAWKTMKEKKIDVVILDSVTMPIRTRIPNAPQNLVIKCLSEDTKVLTKRGWLGYNEVRIGDEILAYDVKTGELKWTPIVDVYVTRYKGKMIHIGGERKGVDILVTPNHKMVVERMKWNGGARDERYVTFKKASELAHLSDRIVRTGKWNGVNYRLITIPGYEGRYRRLEDDIAVPAERFFEFMGFYLAEGWLKKSSTDGEPYMVCLACRKDCESKKKYVEALGLEARYYKTMGSFCIGDKRLAKYIAEVLGLNVKSKEKFIPAWMKEAASHLLERLIDGIIAGDGMVKKHGNSKVLITSSKKLAEDFSEIAVKAGYVVNMIEKRQKTSINGREYDTTMYHVHISRIQTGYWIRKNVVEEVEYDGIIWSPEVPEYHAFVAMRNGKTFITGNSDLEGFIMGQLMLAQDKFGVAALATLHASINPTNPYDTSADIRGGLAIKHTAKHVMYIEWRKKKGLENVRQLWLVRRPDAEPWSMVRFAKIDDLGYHDLDVGEDKLDELLTGSQLKRLGGGSR